MNEADRAGRRPPQTARSTAIGPEAIGAMAAAVVLVVVAVIALGPLTGTRAEPTASPEAVASPTASSGAGTSSAPPTTSLAPWAARAATLIDLDDRLVDQRDALRDLVEADPDRADGIASALRALNGQLTFALDVIDGLEDAGLDAGLVDRLRAVHRTALDASLDGLRASVSDTATYIATAGTVVEALGGLEATAAELARESGLPLAAP